MRRVTPIASTGEIALRETSEEQTPTRQTTVWTRPPKALTVENGVIHVWRIPLLVSQAELAERARVLSTDELVRASRFAFRKDREQYVAARGAVRILLGRYLRFFPHALRFSYEEYGKPVLQTPDLRERIGFNVAHAGAWALCAVAPTPSVGVDVERVRNDLDLMDIAAFGFAEGERAALERSTLPAREAMFFHCWTQKEAYVKALGQGLSASLDSFEVRMDHAAGIQAIYGSEDSARDWTLAIADPAPGFLGAVAGRGLGWGVRFFDGAEVVHRGLERGKPVEGCWVGPVGPSGATA